VLLVAVFCTLVYADYALTLAGARLYESRSKQFVEVPSYELNPYWRDVVERGRYWHPRLIRAFAVYALIVVLLCVPRWMAVAGHVPSTLDWFGVYACVTVAALLSRHVSVIASHLQNIAVARGLMRPELLTGHLVQSAQFTYGRTRIMYWYQALVLAVLAALEPSPVTVGFVLGPLLLVLNLRQMEQRSAKAAAAASQKTAEAPSTEE
jgi:hypothetical protein